MIIVRFYLFLSTKAPNKKTGEFVNIVDPAERLIMSHHIWVCNFSLKCLNPNTEMRHFLKTEILSSAFWLIHTEL